MKRVSLSQKKLGFNIHAFVFVPSTALLQSVERLALLDTVGAAGLGIGLLCALVVCSGSWC